MARLFAVKPLSAIRQEASEEGAHTLRRTLGPINLITLGIGAIIGAGIFVLTGTAAAQFAGPAVVLSFVVAGVGCVFAGLCYAEFASMIPIAGSAYTYGYATLGELVAWIIGWALVPRICLWRGHRRRRLERLRQQPVRLLRGARPFQSHALAGHHALRSRTFREGRHLRARRHRRGHRHPCRRRATNRPTSTAPRS